ncbi:hypothetical protein [Novosphingobium sp. KACC 22771]|uniref:hypothetical protein n=1 Tax=Novosphingobium sp. KACC 22771 TaxID=3025670 RepID=UPI00236628D4|nr:hypothetical protein [Novosphingobium sp. KACC 22771]WDF72854.1 hypothetical protein PQ467_02090 [Novosphingobium sp. KACC 22771]
MPFAIPSALRVNAQLGDLRTAVGRGDSGAAVAYGRESVALVPLDPRRLGLYATALTRKGEGEKAYEVFLTAGKMGWRDPITQYFWMQTAMGLNDGAVAALRLDGMLRTWPSFTTQADLTAPFEVNQQFGDALIARIKLQPEWARDYVASTRLLEGTRLADRLDLLHRLAASGTKVGCAQIAQVVEPMARNGLVNEAYGLWRDHCDDKPAGLLMDGNFEAYNPDYEETVPFRWRVPASGDLNVEDQREKAGGKLLAMRNVSPIPMVAASQIAMVRSGDYRISWLAKDEDGKPSHAIAPQLWCSDANEIVPSNVTALPGGRWQADLRVADECKAWILQFTLQPTPKPVIFGSVSLTKPSAQ